MSQAASPVLRDASQRVCLERALNTFEEASSDPPPSCGANCDVFSKVLRGAITKDFNLGMTFPQSKPLNVDTFNQGCLNPWGCVETNNGVCYGQASSFDTLMNERFKDLMKPLDPSLQEVHPPVYVLGCKAGSDVWRPPQA